jgi:hypothetical protein
MNYTFDNTIITLPVKLRYEIYDTDIAYGIKIYHEDNIYNLHYNRLAKSGRLIIHAASQEDAFTWKDLPYNRDTYALLPIDIIVEEK